MEWARTCWGRLGWGRGASCVLTVSLLLLAGCASPDEAAPWSQRTDAIRNGTQSPQIYPLSAGQQLAIGWLFSPGTPETSFCTGTLIDGRTVVTARHCIAGRTPGTTGFGIGQQPSDPRATFMVEAIETPPDESVDLAVLRLSEDARRMAPDLVPIPFNRIDLDSAYGRGLVGRAVDAAGYGETMDATRTGRWFAQVVVAEITQGFVVVDGQGRQGICFGDSGGPVIAPDDQGLAVVLGVEHAGDESCVGIDHLVRLDKWTTWLDQMRGMGGERCGDLDYRGACSGNVAVWCDEHGRLARRDCTREAMACGYVDDEVGYYCTEKSARADGVGSVARGAPVDLKGGCSQTPAPAWGGLVAGLLLLGLRRRR